MSHSSLIQKNIIVVADDFSGATEIAGIGHRFGLSTEVRSTYEGSGHKNLIVINTDTRDKPRSIAVKKLKIICQYIIQSDISFHFFKKVDSVFRGHIMAEIEVLLNELEVNRAFLLPANPSKGRVISDGRYLVNGERLENTAFMNDPMYPAHSSLITDIIESENSTLNHVHLSGEEDIPHEGVITTDVNSLSDMSMVMKSVNDNDLICGAGDLFEILLRSLGLTEINDISDQKVSPQLNLIINGSTSKNPEIANEVGEGSKFYLNGEIKDDTLVIPDFEAWEKAVLDGLIENGTAAIGVDLDEIHTHHIAQQILEKLSKVVSHIANNINDIIHFYLTGGATAQSIMEQLEVSVLEVIDEPAPGVVTLRSKDTPHLYTVKPGSYPWPEKIYNNW